MLRFVSDEPILQTKIDNHYTSENAKSYFYSNTDTELLEEVSTAIDEGHQLIVYNDDVNTFDHVIQTLIDICKHTPEQAEQCTLIIHFKGKCSVKEGSWNDLVPMRNAICDKGISAEVE